MRDIMKKRKCARKRLKKYTDIEWKLSVKEMVMGGCMVNLKSTYAEPDPLSL